ncbi:short-chain dehydrogenase/reductase family 16C member 6 [Callithrix jacchus]
MSAVCFSPLGRPCYSRAAFLQSINMDVIADSSIFLGKLLYYFLESLVYKIIPKTKKNVAGEIVLITGAGSGLGRQLAIHFARLGAILVLWDINQEGNVETCRLAKEKGGEKVFPYKCDCSNRQEVYRVADQVRKEVGDVTILINNAGVVTGKLLLDIPDDMVEKSFLVNAISHFWTYKAFLPAMIRTNHGHLVCISSVAGLAGINGLSDYSASKFAAFGFAESLFLELTILKKTGIKTTIVCPHFINTGMFEGCTTKYPFLLPILEQEYVAKKIVNAILEEQVYLLIPKFLYIALILKQIMSPKIFIAFCDYLGVYTCMASFKGRKNANELQTETERKHQ